jgi:hypothetical protein
LKAGGKILHTQKIEGTSVDGGRHPVDCILHGGTEAALAEKHLQVGQRWGATMGGDDADKSKLQVTG